MRNPLERSAVYRWYQARRGFAAFAVIVLLAGIGLWLVEDLAQKANDAADTAAKNAETNAELIEQARELSMKARQLGRKNAALTCSLGEAISSSPVPLRTGESAVDYAGRIRVLRQLAADLRRLEDCDPERPIRIDVPPESREAFHEGREQIRSLGGGVTAPSSPPTGETTSVPEGGGIAGPPSGGGGLPPPPVGGGSDTSPPEPPPAPSPPSTAPPAPSEPPDEPALLDPLDPITDPLGVECHITALGIRICS